LFAVPKRVLGLPVPKIVTHRLQVCRGLEPEFLLSEGRVCSEIRNVSTPDRSCQISLGMNRLVEHTFYQ